VPAKCAAYRRHVASLKEVRGSVRALRYRNDKARNAAATSAALAEFTTPDERECKK